MMGKEFELDGIDKRSDWHPINGLQIVAWVPPRFQGSILFYNAACKRRESAFVHLFAGSLESYGDVRDVFSKWLSFAVLQGFSWGAFLDSYSCWLDDWRENLIKGEGHRRYQPKGIEVTPAWSFVLASRGTVAKVFEWSIVSGSFRVQHITHCAYYTWGIESLTDGSDVIRSIGPVLVTPTSGRSAPKGFGFGLSCFRLRSHVTWHGASRHPDGRGETTNGWERRTMASEIIRAGPRQGWFGS